MLTNSLDRIDKHPRNAKWLHDRIVFLITMQNEFPDYYSPIPKRTANFDDIHAVWKNSLAFELHELQTKIPEIYGKAEKEATWKYLDLL